MGATFGRAPPLWDAFCVSPRVPSVSSPLVGGAALAGRRWQLLWRWLPGTLGGVAGFVVFRGLSDLGGGLRGVPYDWPVDQEQWFGALVAAVLAGLVGCCIGVLLGHWRHWLRSLSLRTRSEPTK